MCWILSNVFVDDCHASILYLVQISYDNAETLRGLATVMTAIVAMVAVIVAVIALITGRNSQREATAKAIYRDYLKLAFENPELANPYRGALKRKDDLKQDERYRWFVAFMLNSCGEIARSKPGDETWRKAILEDLKMHNDYLKSPIFDEDGGWPLYSHELRDIWHKAVRSPR
jgi:hypothetical protein